MCSSSVFSTDIPFIFFKQIHIICSVFTEIHANNPILVYYIFSVSLLFGSRASFGKYWLVWVTNEKCSLFRSEFKQAFYCGGSSMCPPPQTLFPDVIAEHFHPPDLSSTRETSALFKRLIPFLIHFSGLTSGYPQMPAGNGHSLDKNDEDLDLFLFSKLFFLTCTVWMSRVML